MSFLWWFFVVCVVVLFSAVLLIGTAFFSPLVFTIDSANRQVRVRWLAALEYRWPLPGAEGKTGLSFAGKSIAIPARRNKRKPRPQARARKGRESRARFARFLRLCLREPALRRILVRRTARLGKRILRAASLTRRQIRVSLPDPAWNGMLAGLLAWRGDGRGSAVRVNFPGENDLFLEVRLYPYRVVKALLAFSIGLPYRALWREWRAASAIASV